MKKTIFLFAVIPAAILSTQVVNADTVAGWTFESSGLGSTTPSYLPGANAATTNFYAESGLDAGTATAYGLHVGAATYTSPAGNGSAKSFSSQTWAQGDYYELVVPLNPADTFSAFSVTYDQNGSTSGPKTYFLAYSINGSSWTDLTDYNLTSGITWAAGTPNQATQLSFDLSGVSALDTASTVYFRVVDDSLTTGGSISGGNIGTAGTDRIDNFDVNATVVPTPEPSTIALAAFGGLASLFLIRRKP